VSNPPVWQVYKNKGGNMKRFFRSGIATFILVSLGSVFFCQASAAPKILKFATAYEATNPMTTSMKWFASELERRTNNQYKTEIYYSGMIGKAPDLPNLCANGMVDFIFTAAGYTPNLFRLTRGFELMYVTENPLAQDAALWEIFHSYGPIRNEWEKNGLILGAAMGCGNMAVQCVDPLNNIDAVKGVKFRSYAAVGKLIHIWGGIPISISYAEVYEALNRGLIKGAFGIPFVNVYDQKWWEVAPYVVDTGIGVYALTYFAISKKTYERFPRAVRKIIDKLREDTNIQHRQWMANFGIECAKRIYHEKRIHLMAWSAEEKSKGKKMAIPAMWEDWLVEMKKNNLPGEEFLDIYRKSVKRYENQYLFESPYAYIKKMK
jgi:TRAP-type C4-dicarboxylate transport system substrate-binding protein